jgi:5'-3' exonuclease
MILCDYNQLAISCVMQHINSDPRAKIEDDLVRHVILNSLRSYIKQFKSQYGKVVVCCDSKKYWRREVFPFYKSHRKKNRDASSFDWVVIFDCLNKIRDELKENYIYPVLEIEGAEADDIIAVLTARYSASESILILSSDKDFVQLQKYKNVNQYSSLLKRFIRTDDPHMFVKEHIIRGDRGDGIPNFLSPDNTFVAGERQKVINKKRLAEWITTSPDDFCTTESMKRGYKRNQMLVDLDYVPESIKDKIVEAFENAKPHSKMKFLDYLIENKLKSLIEIVDEF